MDDVKVVGLIGRKGSGKSTVADVFIKHGYVRVKFADTLKGMLRTFGLTEEHIEGELKELPCDILCGLSPRHAMQTLGTDWARNCMHNDIWVNIWKHKLSLLPKGSKVVVDDVRFENEAAAVQLLGGVLCSIDRPRPYGDGDTHESEAGISKLPTDMFIKNIGGVGDLERSAHQMYNVLKETYYEEV